jgi:hypothetical protein
MNVRDRANRLTQRINPNLTASLRVCIGYTTGTGLKRVPNYAPAVPCVVQIQALTKGDVRHLDGLNITNAERACFANVQLTPVDRKSQSGGDLLTFTDPVTNRADVWLVTAILESWSTAGWCKVALTKQLDVV